MVSIALLIGWGLILLAERAITLVAHDVLLDNKIDVVFLVAILILQLESFDV